MTLPFTCRLVSSCAASQDVGFNTLRVPIGASDFSPKRYTLDDSGSPDQSLNSFNADAAPSELYSVLLDIQSINPYVKLFLAAWTAPAWMKTSNSTDAGQFKDEYAEACNSACPAHFGVLTRTQTRTIGSRSCKRRCCFICVLALM